MTTANLDWLLTGPSYVTYRTYLDLLDETYDAPTVQAARKALGEDPQVVGLIEETARWFAEISRRHDDAKMSHYRLRMLADFGYDISDVRITAIVDGALEHFDNGLPAIRQALPEKGTAPKPSEDFDEWHALTCDATILAATLFRLGCRAPLLLNAIGDIVGRWRQPDGWFCHLFFVESQFRREGAPCMMAALQVLELISVLPVEIVPDRTAIIENAFGALETHRNLGKSLYYFGRGSRFWSLKYPYVWYNALYLAEVLSRFEDLEEEPLVVELKQWLEKTRNDDGTWTPTSMFMAYKGWEFADKKSASPWITFLACRILRRFETFRGSDRSTSTPFRDN